MNPGEVLRTGHGKAEILLTPGVFLRLDDHSAVKMISPDMTADRSRDSIAAARLSKSIRSSSRTTFEITDDGVVTHLAKVGYYEFDAKPATAEVFKGEAVVDEGDGRYQNLKQHHEITLAEGAIEKPASFNTGDAEDSLYKWSNLRSQYLAEANNQIAGEYAGSRRLLSRLVLGSRTCGITPSSAATPSGVPSASGFYPPWGGGGYWRGGFYGGRLLRGRIWPRRLRRWISWRRLRWRLPWRRLAGGGFHGGGGGGRR